MKLNHLNLTVNDLSGARDFFETYFNFQFIEQKGKALIVLCDSDGFILTLVNSNELKDGMGGPYPKAFHLGFLVESSNEVDEIYNRLVEGEIEYVQKPHKMRGNNYGFYFMALNELLIEVSCLVYKNVKKITTD